MQLARPDVHYCRFVPVVIVCVVNVGGSGLFGEFWLEQAVM